jgi:hypothetical protein
MERTGLARVAGGKRDESGKTPESISSYKISRLVLVNSATAFNRSLGGLAGVVSDSGLISVLPEPLYNVAQARSYPLGKIE